MIAATAPGKVILYDDACPMCRAYTAGFVRMGILETTGRIAFSRAGQCDVAALDAGRARHEIPLLDRASGEVVYGLDALFLLIGGRFEGLRPLLATARFRRALTPIYRFISYNRRVIAGCASAAVGEGGFDCAPDFHRGWRIKHLITCGLLWSIALASTARGLAGAPDTLILLTTLALALLCLHAVVVARTRPAQRWDRAGTLATNASTFALLAYALSAPLHGALPETLAVLAAGVVAALDLRRRLHGLHAG